MRPFRIGKKTIDYCEVRESLKATRTLDLHDFSHHQKAIPKASGGTRTLGISPHPWRLYLHGLGQILQIWLSPYAHPFQQGFQSQRGVDTAWKEIHNAILETNTPNIYEYDLVK